MHDWPIAIRFKPEDAIDRGTIYIGENGGWHGGWLCDVKGQAPHPSKLAPVYKGRLSEYSGAFGERLYGTRLILDLADVVWNAMDLLIAGRTDIIPGDEVFLKNAERIRQAVLYTKRVDQEVQIVANELYEKMLVKLRAEIAEAQGDHNAP